MTSFFQRYTEKKESMLTFKENSTSSSNVTKIKNNITQKEPFQLKKNSNTATIKILERQLEAIYNENAKKFMKSIIMKKVGVKYKEACKAYIAFGSELNEKLIANSLDSKVEIPKHIGEFVNKSWDIDKTLHEVIDEDGIMLSDLTLFRGFNDFELIRYLKQAGLFKEEYLKDGKLNHKDQEVHKSIIALEEKTLTTPAYLSTTIKKKVANERNNEFKNLSKENLGSSNVHVLYLMIPKDSQKKAAPIDFTIENIVQNHDRSNYYEYLFDKNTSFKIIKVLPENIDDIDTRVYNNDFLYSIIAILI